jgi:tubulin monoglycylase TTLL3/8
VKKIKKRKVYTGDQTVDNFLERHKPKHVFPNITDLTTWKKKNRLEDNVKVFICSGGYPDIKKALKSRGWVENKDANSPCFDFKWTLKSKDIDHNAINDNQLVNHFNKATSITTKVGLCNNLKNLIWYNNIDIDTFFPGCFDLAVSEEFDDFIEEFKALKAESYVKIFVKEMRDSEGEMDQIEEGKEGNTVSNKVLKVALKICERRLKDLDELIDDPNAFKQLCSEKEWAILASDELDVEKLAKKKHDDWIQRNEVKT